jgi:hypothetical protein
MRLHLLTALKFKRTEERGRKEERKKNPAKMTHFCIKNPVFTANPLQ